MRYQLGETSYILAQFPTGRTVTIDIYRLSDNTKIINSANMIEIGTTGIFKYLQSLNPITLTEYVWIATDIINSRTGKIVLGGYPDTIATSQTNEESDISTIQTDIDIIKASQSSEESDIGTIESDIGTIQTDIDLIKTSQINEESDIEDIQTTIGTINTNIGNIDSDISEINVNIDLIPTLGKGSKEVTYTLTKIDLTPIADANIKVTSDILGLYSIAEGRTNQLGQITFQLEAGTTVYIWRSKTGEVFINPDVEEVPE
jgi:hypothetical protein